MLITGAAGFIGSAAYVYYRDRFHVIGVDDYSRAPRKSGSGLLPVIYCDAGEIPRVLRNAPIHVVLHLAAQVSVTASIQDPRNDFQRNAALTFDLAHWAARTKVKTFIYSSTNKVYGEMAGRIPTPVCDDEPTNPQTPYGISKACGGMYVRELLPDTGYDFRQSCIIGEAQEFHATEDQGWVGYLIRSVRAGYPITCYGDGSQVRDLLHVDDLLRAYDLAIDGKIRPGSYVVGGGTENAVTFEDVVRLLGGTIQDRKPPRPRDQIYFVARSDGLRKAGWRPETSTMAWIEDRAPTRVSV